MVVHHRTRGTKNEFSLESVIILCYNNYQKKSNLISNAYKIGFFFRRFILDSIAIKVLIAPTINFA